MIAERSRGDPSVRCDGATEGQLAEGRTPWRLLTVSECETRAFDEFRQRLAQFLTERKSSPAGRRATPSILPSSPPEFLLGSLAKLI
jgi:hypothetical protein